MSGAEALLSPLANAVGVPPYPRRRIICVRSRRPLPEELMRQPCVKTISRARKPDQCWNGVLIAKRHSELHEIAICSYVCNANCNACKNTIRNKVNRSGDIARAESHRGDCSDARSASWQSKRNESSDRCGRWKTRKRCRLTRTERGIRVAHRRVGDRACIRSCSAHFHANEDVISSRSSVSVSRWKRNASNRLGGCCRDDDAAVLPETIYKQQPPRSVCCRSETREIHILAYNCSGERNLTAQRRERLSGHAWSRSGDRTRITRLVNRRAIHTSRFHGCSDLLEEERRKHPSYRSVERCNGHKSHTSAQKSVELSATNRRALELFDSLHERLALARVSAWATHRLHATTAEATWVLLHEDDLLAVSASVRVPLG